MFRSTRCARDARRHDDGARDSRVDHPHREGAHRQHRTSRVDGLHCGPTPRASRRGGARSGRHRRRSSRCGHADPVDGRARRPSIWPGSVRSQGTSHGSFTSHTTTVVPAARSRRATAAPMPERAADDDGVGGRWRRVHPTNLGGAGEHRVGFGSVERPRDQEGHAEDPPHRDLHERHRGEPAVLARRPRVRRHDGHAVRRAVARTVRWSGGPVALDLPR